MVNFPSWYLQNWYENCVWIKFRVLMFYVAKIEKSFRMFVNICY